MVGGWVVVHRCAAHTSHQAVLSTSPRQGKRAAGRKAVWVRVCVCVLCEAQSCVQAPVVRASSPAASAQHPLKIPAQTSHNTDNSSERARREAGGWGGNRQGRGAQSEHSRLVVVTGTAGGSSGRR